MAGTKTGRKKEFVDQADKQHFYRNRVRRERERQAAVEKAAQNLMVSAKQAGIIPLLQWEDAPALLEEIAKMMRQGRIVRY